MALAKAQVREILSKAGVDAEHMSDAVNEIIDGHTASIEALREQVKTLERSSQEKADEVERLTGVQKELDDLKKQVEKDAKAREGKDYDKLKAEFDGYKADIEKRDAHVAKETAFRALLKDAEIDQKYFDKIVKYSDVDSIELDAEGKMRNAAERLKAVKEEWPEYHVTTQEKGAETATPPANNGGANTKTRDEILAIEDDTERQKAIEENHEMFGF